MILCSDWTVLVVRYFGFRRDLLSTYCAMERPILTLDRLLDDEKYLTRWSNVTVHYAIVRCSIKHRWELPGNYPFFTVAMVIYHYVERIWRILVTHHFLYNIYNHE